MLILHNLTTILYSNYSTCTYRELYV
jgi:hypothetical protein